MKKDTKKIFILIKTKEKLITEGYFRDKDGDYWEKEEFMKFWTDESEYPLDDEYKKEYELSLVASKAFFGKVFYIAQYKNQSLWLAEKVITPEDDAEYFV